MRKIAAFFSLFLFSFPLSADPLTDWASRVHEIKLKNGMTFLLYNRGEAPIFTAYIRVKAGGIDEEPGKTGLAHFMEHMAFKGTETIGTTDFKKEKPILDKMEKVGGDLSLEAAKGTSADAEKIRRLQAELKKLYEEEQRYALREAFSKIVLKNGGNDQNATTSKDMTSYFVSMPADRLKFWAEIESERIFKPVFREFYQEKEVVREERRMRVDNDPEGRLYEAFLQTAFEKSPYQWPTIGSDRDLVGLTVADLRAFWKKFYRPSHMVGVLVGRLDIKAAEKILNETFGVVASQEGGAAPPVVYAEEPRQIREKRVELSLPARPRVLIGYHKPTLPYQEDYVFDLIDQILGEGRSSRLYRSLVLEKKIVSDISTSSGVPGSRLANLFLIEAHPLDGHSTEEVLQAVDREIAAMQREGVTEEELLKARNQLTVGQLWSMKTNEGLASGLSYYQSVAGNWRYLAGYLEEINRFASSDIQSVMGRYLNPDNRTVAVLKPVGGKK